METQLPFNWHSSQFSAHVYCGQAVGWIRMPLGMEAGLGPGHIVLDGDPAPFPSPKKKLHSPQFSTHVCCGQNGSRCHLVWRKASARAQAPIFGPCLLWPKNGWIYQDATCYGRPRLRRHCVRWGPSFPSRGKAPNFRPTSIVAKRLDGLGCQLVRW